MYHFVKTIMIFCGTRLYAYEWSQNIQSLITLEQCSKEKHKLLLLKHRAN